MSKEHKKKLKQYQENYREVKFSFFVEYKRRVKKF